MRDETIIKAEKIRKVYGSGPGALEVLKGISLDVNKGEIISIVGPSGAGKSTLLNIIGCLDGIESGSLSVMGHDVSRRGIDFLSSMRNRHIGFIFQLHNLLPEFTALENVMMPLLIRRESKKTAMKTAGGILERFNLADRLNHKPSELSGGESQRVTVARAMVGKPDIILADEPTGSLDSVNSLSLIRALFELGRENGSTVIIVTHDKDIASMTERTISMIDGRVVEESE